MQLDAMLTCCVPMLLLLLPILASHLPVCPPMQGRRDGSTRDEPFAWQSREFLRKLCVGKVRWAVVGGRQGVAWVALSTHQHQSAACAGSPPQPLIPPALSPTHRPTGCSTLPPTACLQPCVFRIDYALEAAGGKEFGTVFINEKENVAVSLLGAGWGKVS